MHDLLNDALIVFFAVPLILFAAGCWVDFIKSWYFLIRDWLGKSNEELRTTTYHFKSVGKIARYTFVDRFGERHVTLRVIDPEQEADQDES